MSITSLVSDIRNEIQSLTQSVVVEEQVYHSRVAECKQCDQYLETTLRCNECGCFVPFKAQMRKSKCPIGKW